MTDNRYGVEFASDINTPASRLRQLIDGSRVHNDPAIRDAVLGNPNCPSDILVSYVVKYRSLVAIRNPGLQLALLEKVDPKLLESIDYIVLLITLHIVLACTTHVWKPLATHWLSHVALPRDSIEDLSDARLWSRNYKSLCSHQAIFPSEQSTKGLLRNALVGHQNKAGALMSLARTAQGLRSNLDWSQKENDEILDVVDGMLRFPRCEEVYPGVSLVTFERVSTKKAARLWRHQQTMSILPGIEASDVNPNVLFQEPDHEHPRAARLQHQAKDPHDLDEGSPERRLLQEAVHRCRCPQGQTPPEVRSSPP